MIERFFYAFYRLTKARSKFTKIEQEKEAICKETETVKATLSKRIKSLKIKCSRRGKIIEVKITTEMLVL